jgi:hypothetical protein
MAEAEEKLASPGEEVKEETTELPKDAHPFVRNMSSLLDAFESKKTPFSGLDFCMKHWLVDLHCMVLGSGGVGPDHPKLWTFYNKCLKALDVLDVDSPELLAHGPPRESDKEREDLTTATAESILEATSVLYREKQQDSPVIPDALEKNTTETEEKETKQENTELPKDAAPFAKNFDALLKAFESKKTPRPGCDFNMRCWYFDLRYMILGQGGVGPDHPKLELFYDKCLRALDVLDITRPQLLPHGPPVKSHAPESEQEREDVAAATAESVLEATSVLYRETRKESNL